MENYKEHKLETSVKRRKRLGEGSGASAPDEREADERGEGIKPRQ